MIQLKPYMSYTAMRHNGDCFLHRRQIKTKLQKQIQNEQHRQNFKKGTFRAVA